jgi:hypothetical protein
LSPWAAEDDSAGIDDGAGAPSSPLVLGDVDGVSITGQMQEQLPQQSAPAHGSELSGEVASLGGALSPPEIELDKGSKWGGMRITCIFAVLITLVGGGTFIWAESTDEWHYDEPVQFSWTNSSQTSGSFTLSGAPIQECSIRFHSVYENEPDAQAGFLPGKGWNLDTGCSYDDAGDIEGVLRLYYARSVGRFNGENSSVTFKSPIPPVAGASVTAQINGEKNGHNVLEEGVSLADGVSTEFTFPFNMTDVDRCRFFIVFIVDEDPSSQESQRWVYETWAIDPDQQVPPECGPLELIADVNGEQVGFIDYRTGFAQLTLFEPLPEGMQLLADYREKYSPADQTVSYVGPALGGIAGAILALIWLWWVFKAYHEGLSDKGIGMLIGIIPGSILSAIVLGAIVLLIGVDLDNIGS